MEMMFTHYLKGIHMSEKVPSTQDQLQADIRTLLDRLASKIREEVELRVTQTIYQQVVGAVKTVIPPASTMPSPASPSPFAKPPSNPMAATVLPPPPRVPTPPETVPATPSSRRSKVELESLAKAVYTQVKRHGKSGIRSEELAREMGLSTHELEKPIQLACAWGWLGKRGSRRGMQYLPGRRQP